MLRGFAIARKLIGIGQAAMQGGSTVLYLHSNRIGRFTRGSRPKGGDC